MNLCEERGAAATIFTGAALNLPHYDIGGDRTAGALALVEALRDADGVAIVSPGYHGSISGLLKNALDYVQDLAEDTHPYLDGRRIALIGVAAGWQAAATTLACLRTITHALRGWPTPLGMAINSQLPVFERDRGIIDPSLASQFEVMASQLLSFPEPIALTNLENTHASAARGCRD